jgi:ubiquinone/menaquinone biosynthesis C-methylase UbiE
VGSCTNGRLGDLVNPALFSSPEYVQFRFGYPKPVFHPVIPFFNLTEFDRPLRVLDLGCGTGLVTASFLNSVQLPVELHLVDVDSGMLEVAKNHFQQDPRVVTVQCAPSESIPHPDGSFDVILVGSAWHWMRPQETVAEVDRLLVPGGGIYVFEYQFPRAVRLPELNEWIRVQFNTLWKPANQVPRGSLFKLTSILRDHTGFSQVDSMAMNGQRMHDAAELVGVIASQSRYQHFEQSLPEESRMGKRQELQQALAQWMSDQACAFSYPYEGYLFKKRR